MMSSLSSIGDEASPDIIPVGRSKPLLSTAVTTTATTTTTRAPISKLPSLDEVGCDKDILKFESSSSGDDDDSEVEDLKTRKNHQKSMKATTTTTTASSHRNVGRGRTRTPPLSLPSLASDLQAPSSVQSIGSVASNLGMHCLSVHIREPVRVCLPVQIGDIRD